MTKTVAYHWHLRRVMNEHGMQSTTDLVPPLADRGVVMTSTQVYRIVTGQPLRMNMRFLAALCDIFDVTPNDLIEPYVATNSRRGRKTGTTRDASGKPLLRITETARFEKKHREIAPATWKRASIKSPANCGACHTQTAAGDYSERSITIPK